MRDWMRLITVSFFLVIQRRRGTLQIFLKREKECCLIKAIKADEEWKVCVITQLSKSGFEGASTRTTTTAITLVVAKDCSLYTILSSAGSLGKCCFLGYLEVWLPPTLSRSWIVYSPGWPGVAAELAELALVRSADHSGRWRHYWSAANDYPL